MNSPYHYIGLDVHKHTVVFCEKRADGELVEAGSFRTRRSDMARWAESRTRPWVGGMEATLFSGYIYDVLSPYALDLQVGHSLRIKAISTAKHKSDKVDAQTLANLLRADLFPECYMASTEVRDLRRMLRYRNFMVHQAVTMKNKITGILMETGIPYDGRRIHGKTYSTELFDALENLEEAPACVVKLLRSSRSALEMFQDAQKELLKALIKDERLRQRVALLRTIPGVGAVTALTWALEIDDPARFSSIKHAQSYCGLCSGQNESAGKSKNGPLSKQRNAHLQTVLIEAAKLAPRYNPQLNRVHAAALEKNKIRNRATCAVARKLVALLMAVDKSGTAYQDRAGV